MSYEEWKAAKPKAKKEPEGSQKRDVPEQKPVDSPVKSGIINSGGISGALNPESDRAAEHAKRYYEEMRHRTDDIAKIAEHSGMTTAEISAIKRYIFFEEHDLGDVQTGRFDPSYAMAESWRRLIDGNDIQPHDITLLKHELREMSLVKGGMPQDMAHTIASREHNYSKGADEYYDKVTGNK